MFERILVATDGSAGSEAVLSAVAALARGGDGAEVLVVHVSDHGRLVRTVHGRDSLTLQYETPAHARHLVEGAVQTLRAAGVRARGEVYGQFDTVARELLEAARIDGAGLLAMGTRGRGRVAATLLGSTAHRVVHLAEIALLVVPPAARAPAHGLGRILLAVDGSAASRRALDAAAEAALRTSGQVVVLHVCEPGHASWQRYLASGVAVEVDSPDSARLLVGDAVQALEQRGVAATPAVRMTTGSVAEDILDTATAQGSDLLVLGSRGRSALPALVLGSTAYRVLHGTVWPVIVTR